MDPQRGTGKGHSAQRAHAERLTDLQRKLFGVLRQPQGSDRFLEKQDEQAWGGGRSCPGGAPALRSP